MSAAMLDCHVEARRRALLGNSNWNGIDYLEVGADQRELTLHLFGAVPLDIGVANVLIEGGRRITGIGVVAVQPLASADETPARSLRITLDRSGDFSTYTLRLVEPPKQRERKRDSLHGFDERYSSIDFNFKIACPNDFDCVAVPVCPPATIEPPDINYLAKDYETFRQLLFDRLAVTMPGWRERHVPDIGVTLVELLAYVADRLSYYQDAVATEAYLDTARTRISVRRHARLVDYRLHEGCNARAWLTIACEADVALPGDAYFVTRQADIDRLAGKKALAAADLAPIATRLYEVFEPAIVPLAGSFRLIAAHGTIAFYTWGDAECCLPKGATRATLLDDPSVRPSDSAKTDASPTDSKTPPTDAKSAPAAATVDGAQSPREAQQPKRPLDLQAGDVLIFEEVLGPTTGNPADADPTHRHAVRLTGVEPGFDDLLGHAVVNIEWAREDALPFPLCLSARLPAPDCRRIDGISVAHGNVILVDHGRSVTEPVPLLPGDEIFGECGCADVVTESVEQPATFAEPLANGPLIHREPASPQAPAASALAQDPRSALPVLAITEQPAASGAAAIAWNVHAHLLASSGDARDIAVEIDDDGRAHLRCGDGRLGRQPPAASAFAATYRVGDALAGNVPAESIAYVALRNGRIDRLQPRNPMPAQGGTAPETLAEAKLAAPHAFRSRLARAITADDYAQLAAADARLQRANAQLVWTGSWYEADVAIDPLGSETAPPSLLKGIRRRLEAYRRVGQDLEVEAARYVPLAVMLRVCVKPDYLRGHVAAAVLDVLGNRALPNGTLGFFHADRQSFGDDVYADDLVAAAARIEGVESVVVIELRRFEDAPSDPPSIPDALWLDLHEIAQLDNDPNFPEHGTLTLTLGGGR